MQQINFQSATWRQDAANEIVRIQPYQENGQTLHRIFVRQQQFAEGLPAGHPQLVLAEHIRSILPNEMAEFAHQAAGFAQGGAVFMPANP